MRHITGSSEEATYLHAAATDETHGCQSSYIDTARLTLAMTVRCAEVPVHSLIADCMGTCYTSTSGEFLLGRS